MSERVQDFNDVLIKIIRKEVGNIHTSIPAIVEEYDASKPTVVVKPLIRKLYDDGDTLAMPRIYNVPVVFPRTNNFSFTFPISKGDQVLLIFSERCLDEYLFLGGEQTPQDPRTFDLSDAIAIPGLFPFEQGKLPNNNEDVKITYKNTSITIKANGDIEIGGSSLQSLMTKAAMDFFNLHVHADPVSGFSGPPTSLMTEVLHCTSKTKAL